MPEEITKVEMFAAMAMQGILSGHNANDPINIDEITSASIDCAYALIAKLNS